jgi:hypothetical protein
LSLAAASFSSGYLQVEFGRAAYLFMAAIALAGLGLAALLLRRGDHPAPEPRAGHNVSETGM